LRCAGAVRSADGTYAAPSRSFPKNERAFVSACEYSAEPVPILNDGELAGMVAFYPALMDACFVDDERARAAGRVLRRLDYQ